MEEGKVKFFNEKKGFGFITREGDHDIFFHHSAIQNHDVLQEGDEVKFRVGEGDRGPVAKDIMKV